MSDQPITPNQLGDRVVEPQSRDKAKSLLSGITLLKDDIPLGTYTGHVANGVHCI